MNILFITPSFPSSLHRIRSLNIIKALAQKHKVHLLSLSSKAESETETAEIKPFCESIKIVVKPTWKSWLDCILYLFSNIPLEAAYCKSKAMERTVNEIIKKENINFIYVKRLRSAQWINIHILASVKVVLDTTDAMSLFYKRAFYSASFLHKLFYLREWWAYSSYEKKIFKKFKYWIVCAENDLKYLKSKCEDSSFFLIPNVVDTSEWKQTSLTPRRNSLLFSGIMNKFVNIEGATFLINKIIPIVQKEIPDIILSVVGPNPPAKIKKLESRTVSVPGYVKDIKTVMAQHEIIVCPIRTGTGSRNKILQAWAIGRPVITTQKGLEGLEGQDGVHVLMADTAEKFSEKLVELSNNPLLREKLVASSRTLVENEYSLLVLEKLFNNLINTIST